MGKIFKGCLTTIGAVVVIGILIAIFASGGEDDTSANDSSETVEQEPNEETTDEASEEPKEETTDETNEEPKEEPAEEPSEEVNEEPEMTLAQENALRAAQDYLDYTAFSKAGLIEQLQYEEYSKEDATFAANNVEVDWKEQAVQSGKDYLDYTSFSRNGLIEQLEYDGFTNEQATYAVNQIGL